MYDKKPKTYKLPTMLAVGITAAALAVTILTRPWGEAASVPTQGTAGQKDMSYYTPKPSASQGTALSSSPSSDGPYRVALFEGKIGVFEEGQTEPFLTADVDAYLLPKEDIALLRKGLEAKDLTEVKRILEDYE